MPYFAFTSASVMVRTRSIPLPRLLSDRYSSIPATFIRGMRSCVDAGVLTKLMFSIPGASSRKAAITSFARSVRAILSHNSAICPCRNPYAVTNTLFTSLDAGETLPLFRYIASSKLVFAHNEINVAQEFYLEVAESAKIANFKRVMDEVYHSGTSFLSDSFGVL